MSWSLFMKSSPDDGRKSYLSLIKTKGYSAAYISAIETALLYFVMRYLFGIEIPVPLAIVAFFYLFSFYTWKSKVSLLLKSLLAFLKR